MILTSRTVVCALLLLLSVAEQGTIAADALDRYNARLLEISRVYNQQFAEIRRAQRLAGSGKSDLLATDRKVKQLAMLRTQAITEARLTLEREQQDEKAAEPTAPAKVPRAQRNGELWAAQQHSISEGQKAFWARIAQEEPAFAKLWAGRLTAAENGQSTFWTRVASRDPQEAQLWGARIQSVEGGQNTFWTDLFGPASQGSTERR